MKEKKFKTSQFPNHRLKFLQAVWIIFAASLIKSWSSPSWKMNQEADTLINLIYNNSLRKILEIRLHDHEKTAELLHSTSLEPPSVEV